MNEIPKSVENMLPTGEFLRTFLSQPYVSKGELKSILRNRGIFVFGGEKKDYIPILTSTTLCPSEFEDLARCHQSREDSKKNTTQFIPWQSEETLLDSLPEQFSIQQISEGLGTNFVVDGSPSFYPVNKNPDHIRIDFKIVRKDLSKCWAETDKVFPGSIEMRKVVDKGKVKLVVSHTAKETKQLGNAMTTSLVKNFKQENCVPVGGELRRIDFNSFKTNQERIQFFLELSVETTSNKLIFREIVDLGLCPDQQKKLPKTLDWMSDKIEDLRLNGKSLHETFFVQEKSNHEFILLHKVVVKYDYEIDVDGELALGSCEVSLQFPEYSKVKDSSSELEAVVKSVAYAGQFSSATKSEIQKVILEEIDTQKFEKFLSYVEE